MDKDLLDKARDEINEIDMQMAELFARRMRAVSDVARYKSEYGLTILDEKRERQVIERNSEFIEDDELRGYYRRFIKGTMTISRDYQNALIEKDNKIIVSLAGASYEINIGRGLINQANRFFNLERRALIVTDDGVPKEYAERVGSLCKEARIITIKQGEASKSAECFKALCHEMLDFGLTRSDCVIAVGGGVVGDLSGFAAASYMRGVDFYNIPTTLLSQVDSSIGGKTAINLGGVKNIVGAFYQPKAVIIDTQLLSTLPKRQLANGMAEVIKMSLTSDEYLFEILENGVTGENIEDVIVRALKIKKSVVEIDEREGGLRKILNFGHTLGHGIEAAEELNGLYHGECVAIGMTSCSSPEVKERLIPLLEQYGLPTRYDGDIDTALSFIKQDKKCEGDEISVILVDNIGKYRIEKMKADAFIDKVCEEYKK